MTEPSHTNCKTDRLATDPPWPYANCDLVPYSTYFVPSTFWNPTDKEWRDAFEQVVAKAREWQKRLEALDKLANQAQELDMGY